MKELKDALIKSMIKKLNDGLNINEVEFSLLKYLEQKSIEPSTIDGFKTTIGDGRTINKLIVDKNEICTEIIKKEEK